jgi:uncharacterized protein YukE
MSGSEGFLGLSVAAAVEQVRAAQRQVASLVDDMEGVTARLRAAADIPWSGAAARAWQARLDAARRGVAAGESDLQELHDLLSALLDRIR